MKVKLVIEYTLDGCSISSEEIETKVQNLDFAYAASSKQTAGMNLAIMRLFKANTWDVKISGEEIKEVP